MSEGQPAPQGADVVNWKAVDIQRYGIPQPYTNNSGMLYTLNTLENVI